jgi:OOP family OmpA-OmpF porin
MKSAATRGLAAAALTMAVNGAFAQAPAATPWMGDFWGSIGIAGGESKFRNDCRSADVFSCDHRDSAWRAWADGQMNRVLGLEVGYTDLGKVAASGGQTKAWAADLSLKAGVPVGHFDIFAKGGGVYARTDITADPSTIFDTGHKDGWGTKWGVGAAFAITPNIAIRADWDRYNLDFVGGSRGIDLASAGVEWRF